MKAPAFLVSARSGLIRLAGRLGKVVPSLSGRLVSLVGGRALRFIAIGLGALAVAIAAGALIAGLGYRQRRADSGLGSPRVGGRTQAPSYSAAEVPRSGPELAAMLLIPEADEWPYPLALEPKPRYTEAEAAAFRPDIGAVDVSELTRRRKAELEAIYGAVD
ncbi:MAG: hypothetical protein KKA67_07310 [Spirochaetes bacterium]|nr:hypothetical protein [Spirochaetota bacterium]MBU1082020.1 hypothetical protein [Spirochaetota bacterium]